MNRRHRFCDIIGSLFVATSALLLLSSASAGLITASGSRYAPASGGGGAVLPNFPYDDTRSIVSNARYADSALGSNANSCTAPGASACQTIAGVLGKGGSGTFYLNGTFSQSAQVNISGSGSSGNPREITSLPGGTATIDCNGLARCFELDGANYWKFSHLTFMDWGGPGSVGAMAIAEDIETVGFEMYAIYGETSRHDDNQGLVHYYQQERAPNTVLNRIRLKFTGNGATAHENTGCLYVNHGGTNGSPITLNHIECDNFPSGIYHKHGVASQTTLTGATLSNSIITNSNRISAGYNPAGWLYTNVIFGVSPNPVTLAEDDGGDAGDANEFVHVTFYSGLRLYTGDDNGGLAGAQNNKLTNSMIRTTLVIDSAGYIRNTSNYNAFAPGSVIDGMNLTAWRLANGSDANSEQGTITLVGGADNTLPAFYALAPGSTGKNAASDGSDMGADVTTVGAQAP